MPQAEDLVSIGVVVRPHGVRGELVVEASGDTLAELQADEPIWLLDPPREHRLVGLRPHQARWLLTLADVNDRDEAEMLRGRHVAVDARAVAPPQPGEVYVDDLVGCLLSDPEGRVWGPVVTVQQTGPQDLLEVESEGARVLVPMARDWLVEVDLEARRLVMRVPSGLFGVQQSRRKR